MTPVRVQLRRTLGWRMPANTVSVARPRRWGNPFTVALVGLPAAVEGYRMMLTGSWNPDVFQHLSQADYAEAYAARLAWMARIGWAIPSEGAVQELRGKNLGCWCHLDLPCHADVLLEVANRGR